jgi:hypothetical protein
VKNSENNTEYANNNCKYVHTLWRLSVKKCRRFVECGRPAQPLTAVGCLITSRRCSDTLEQISLSVTRAGSKSQLIIGSTWFYSVPARIAALTLSCTVTERNCHIFMPYRIPTVVDTASMVVLIPSRGIARYMRRNNSGW